MKTLLLAILFQVSFINAFAASYGVIGDAGHWNNNSKGVRDSMISYGVKDLVMPGDNIYDTSLDYDIVWGPWIEKGFKFSVVALGNHYLDIPMEMEFFNMPAKFFYKDFDDTRFIVLDSETMDVLGQQKSFLEDALSSSDKNFNIIVYHHPMASISYRHGWRERESFHLTMRPVLKKWSKKINLIINGHDHIASLFTYDELPVLVSGAVFESISAPAFSYQQEDGGYVLTRWVNNEGYYWVKLDTDISKDLIELTFVRSDVGQESCKVILRSHKVIRHQSCLENGSVGDVLLW